MHNISEHRAGRASARKRAGALGLLALLMWAGAAGAGSDERKGTGGAQELRIPVGPRGNALGGAIAGDVSGIEAAFWNPAGLATIERTEALFSSTRYFADMRLNYLALGTHVGDLGTLGLQLKALSVGDIIVTTEAAPEGTGEVLQPTFVVMGLSWARTFTDRVKFGVTADYVGERIQDMTASGLAFDFGVQYQTGWRNLQFGVVMKNFGSSMQFGGPGLETSIQPPGSDPSATNRIYRLSSAPFEMPSYFTFSATYDMWRATEQRVTFHSAFQNNNFAGDNLSAGLEWDYRHVFALRGSYVGSIVNVVDPDTGAESMSFTSGDDLYGGLAFGAGTTVRVGGTKLGVDLSWRQVDRFFDDVIETGVRMQF